MRIHWTFAICLLLVLWSTAGISVMAAPTAEFEATSFDFGRSMEGEKIKAVFHVKNVGDADLEITNVRAGCGCTDAKASESRIQPGKSAVVEAVFNTTGYRSQVSKTVTVTTNDPAQPTVVLTIKGEVVPIADLKPQAYLNLGDMKPGATSLSDFVVVPNVKQTFQIVRAVSSGKHVSVLRFDRKRNRAGNYALKIRVIAGHTPGRFYEQISLLTDLPGNHTIRLPVYGNVVSNDANSSKP